VSIVQFKLKLHETKSCSNNLFRLFLVFTLATTMGLTYAAVQSYGHESLEEGLLYHFQRVDHRHNYSMYWYWIYLSRGRAASSALSTSASLWGHIPTIPQIFILGFTSLGIAPYDLTLALFLQTFAFVAFNKVMTAQYFTWYLCLLPLCSDRIIWRSKRMLTSLVLLGVSIVSWLLSAFTLEMLGWRTQRQVWLASAFFFIANINLLVSILDGYKAKNMSVPGQGWAKMKLT
jgi:phosphatidylinositol glycan class M